MVAQRVRIAESRIEPRLSNGPLRAQGTAEGSVFCDVGHTSVVRNMLVFRKRMGEIP